MNTFVNVRTGGGTGICDQRCTSPSSITVFEIIPVLMWLPSGVVGVNEPDGDEKEPMTVSFTCLWHCTSLLILLNLVVVGKIKELSADPEDIVKVSIYDLNFNTLQFIQK
jgi:hypothetical protein